MMRWCQPDSFEEDRDGGSRERLTSCDERLDAAGPVEDDAQALGDDQPGQRLRLRGKFIFLRSFNSLR